MNSLQWMQYLLSYFLQAAFVMALACGLDHRVQNPRAKTRIWTACWVTLLTMLAAGLLLPRLQWLDLWAGLNPRQRVALADLERVLGIGLLAGWGCGCGCVIVSRIVQFIRLQRFMRRCPEVTENDAARIRSSVGAALVKDIPTRFRVAPEQLSPFCYQFHTPVVFLSRSLLDCDSAQLRHVLHHELTHLRTQHPLQLFLQRLVQAVLWFHPLVWVAGRRADLAREFVCDDAAAGDVSSTVSYLNTLLWIVQQRTRLRGGVLAIGRSPSELRTRVRRLAVCRQHDKSCRERFAFTGVVLAALLVSQLWLPVNVMASSHSRWSPWPAWSAAALHLMGINARDFEAFDHRTQAHELLEDQAKQR